MGYDIIQHPDTGEPLIRWEGGTHGLGCKPKNLSAWANQYPPVGATYPDIPKSQLQPVDNRPFCVPVLDQGQTSACGPHALVEVMGQSFAMTGDEKPLLSAWWAYGHTNGGQDGGTTLPDLLRLAETKGVPRDSLVKHGNMFGPYPATADAESGRWKIEAAYNLVTWANLLSATQRPGHAALIGIDVGSAFEPDAQGFLPPFQPDPRGVQGHALSACGLVIARGLEWPIIQNHWTAQWGVGGFAFLHPSYWNPTFGGWVLRTVRDDPSDPTPSPAAQ